MTPHEQNNVFKEMTKKLLPFLYLSGKTQENLDNPEAQKILAESKEKLTALSKSTFGGQRWKTWWFLGKISESFGQWEEANKNFLRSHKVSLKDDECDDKACILRELAGSCLMLQKYSEYLYYSQLALEFEPDDYTLWANVASAHLFCNHFEEAEKWANKTEEKLPGDFVAAYVFTTLKGIKAGELDSPLDIEKVRKYVESVPRNSSE